MPTNISTPIWRCDICATRFDADREAAERCERAGHPLTLPTGTPLLVHRDAGRDGTPARFDLVPLTLTDRITTDATRYDPAHVGHHRVYTVPSAVHGSGGVMQINDAHLSPLRPGYLHVRSGTGRRPVGDDPGTGLAGWAADLLGVAQPGSPAATGARPGVNVGWDSSAQWVKPITPEVRAVFDALGVHLNQRLRLSDHQRDWRAANYELGAARGYARHAAAALALRNPAARDAAIADLQARWFAGQDIHAPLPDLTTTSTRTASTLTKDLKALVAATGVDWPPRTDAHAFVNHLIRETLMTITRADTALFPGTQLIAVAGVKGGVGKSTVAAALATALAASGTRVTLVDLDVAGPSQHLLWELGPVPVDVDTMTVHATETDVPGLSVFSSGQLADGLPRRWDDALTTQWLGFIGSVLDVSGTDVVVLDLPAGLGVIDGMVTSSGRGLNVSTVVHVTTAHPLALEDVARGLPLDMHARHRNVVVENMSRVTGIAADGAMAEVRLFGHPTAVADLAQTHRATYGGSLPWATDHRDLAATDELTALADLVRQP